MKASDQPQLGDRDPPADGLASRIMNAWPADRPFRLESVLRERPELARDRSLLVDLAYEEFCWLEERGAGPQPSEFLARFPEIERSLRRVLVLHDFCWNTPEVRQALLPAPWPVAGDEVGGFRLVAEIGRGAASRVFVARDLELAGRLVVAKLGRSRQEADAIGVLEHPNIVPVFSAGRDAATGLSVLCMPFLGRATLDAVIDALFGPARAGGRVGPPRTGADLAAAVASADAARSHSPAADESEPDGIRPRPYPGRFADAVAGWGAELAAALAHAHDRGVTHCDVKPSNVLVAPAGTPMLLDFNLARRSDREARSVGGTLAYMAPERLAGWERGESEATPAADVFALGATLYELLTGRLPFGPLEERDPRAAAAELRERQRCGPDPIPNKVLPARDPLRRLVFASLNRDPAARPSAEELAASLGASLPRRQEKFTRRQVLIAAVGVAVTGATGVAEWRRGHGAPTRGLGGTSPAALDRSSVRSPAAHQTGIPREAGVAAPEEEVRPRTTRKGVALDDAWSQALAAADKPNYAEATELFSLIVEADPGDLAALVARGWCRLCGGDKGGGYQDLLVAYRWPVLPVGRAFELKIRGRYDAAFGYAAILVGSLKVAAAAFERAVSNGFETAAVRNDAGFCCLQSSTTRVGAAEVHLKRAVEINDGLGQAHHNLALWDLRNPDRAGPPDLEFIRRALELGPPTRTLFLDATLIFARACARGLDSERDLERVGRAAVAAGAEPAGVRRIVAAELASFESRSWLTSLAGDGRSMPAPKTDFSLERVVSPFGGVRELLGPPYSLADVS